MSHRARMSGTFREAFGSQEAAARLIDEMEANPMFRTLLAQGVIRPIHLRGVIPYDRYVAHMHHQAIEFVERHQLDAKPDWRHVLGRPLDQGRIRLWAEQWGVPENELSRALRFLNVEPTPSRNRPGPAAGDERELAARAEIGDLTDILAIASEFVKQYGLSEQAFLDFVLSGRYNARQLAERFGCPAQDAECLLDAMARLEILQIFEAATSAPVAQQMPTALRLELVAEVAAEPDGGLCVRMLSSRLTARYLIDRERLNAWCRTRSNCEELRPLLEQLQAVNERNGAMMRILHAICSFQHNFLLSADPVDLRPLQQSEVARRANCHRSVVSRLVRGLVVASPHGRYTLIELMPRHKDVVIRLARMNPEWSDTQIAACLAERYDLHISRRTVNYHRKSSTEAADRAL